MHSAVGTRTSTAIALQCAVCASAHCSARFSEPCLTLDDSLAAATVQCAMKCCVLVPLKSRKAVTKNDSYLFR
jgi:hypothetical protein